MLLCFVLGHFKNLLSATDFDKIPYAKSRMTCVGGDLPAYAWSNDTRRLVTAHSGMPEAKPSLGHWILVDLYGYSQIQRFLHNGGLVTLCRDLFCSHPGPR